MIDFGGVVYSQSRIWNFKNCMSNREKQMKWKSFDYERWTLGARNFKCDMKNVLNMFSYITSCRIIQRSLLMLILLIMRNEIFSSQTSDQRWMLPLRATSNRRCSDWSFPLYAVKWVIIDWSLCATTHNKSVIYAHLGNSNFYFVNACSRKILAKFRKNK